LSNQDATVFSYYISVGSSTCFGCWHPSSGNRTTVITASVTGLLGLLPSAVIIELLLIQFNNESRWYSTWLTSARSYNYSCTSSWWWVSSPETCRAAYRNIINWIQSHLFGQLLNLIHDPGPMIKKKMT